MKYLASCFQLSYYLKRGEKAVTKKHLNVLKFLVKCLEDMRNLSIFVK